MNLSEPTAYQETNPKFIGYKPKVAITRLNYKIADQEKPLSQVLFQQIEILYDECMESGNYQSIDKDINRLYKIGLIEQLIRRDRGFFGDYPTSDNDILFIDRAIGLNIRKGELTEKELKLIDLYQSTSQDEKVISFIVSLHISRVGGLYRSEEELFLMFKHACILLGFLHSPDPDWILKSARASVAKSGGDKRTLQFAALEAETIRLYELNKHKWDQGRSHAGNAALELTPQIVKFSKGDGDLLPTTTKPLEWIRAYIKNQS